MHGSWLTRKRAAWDLSRAAARDQRHTRSAQFAIIPLLKPPQSEPRAPWARRAGNTPGRRARSRPTRGPAGAGPRSRRRRGQRALPYPNPTAASAPTSRSASAASAGCGPAASGGAAAATCRARQQGRWTARTEATRKHRLKPHEEAECRSGSAAPASQDPHGRATKASCTYDAERHAALLHGERQGAHATHQQGRQHGRDGGLRGLAAGRRCGRQRRREQLQRLGHDLAAPRPRKKRSCAASCWFICCSVQPPEASDRG